MEGIKTSAASLQGLKESTLLRKMAELEDRLEKSSNETDLLEGEMMKVKENIAVIDDYIRILSSSEAFPSYERGLSWQQRVDLLKKEKREELEFLRKLEERWLDVLNFKTHHLQKQLDLLVDQEKSLFESKFSFQRGT